MGLLDDAIREHLDLKRRHGADPTEVERAEREALGPVRRAPETGPGVQGPGVQAEADELSSAFAYDQEEDRTWDDDAFQDAPVARSRRREPEPDLDDEGLEDDEPSPQPVEARPSRFSRIFGKPEPEADPESEDEAEPEHADEVEPDPTRSHAGDETVVHELEEEEEDDAAPAGDEDVLEETPEFLQDTPDHDRLWFEQRPPRDFDIDR
jgi:hypothetical protein